MDTETIRTEIAKHRWWHRIDLGDGIVTPGECDHGQTQEELSTRWALPADLSNARVLDIGCWDGLFTIASLRRGAKFVHAVDICDRPTFRLVVDDVLGLSDRSLFLRRDAQAPLDVFGDIVLCFGVLYHVERPMEVIRNAVMAAGEKVIIETAIMPAIDPIAWTQARGHDGDPTNIWYPTPGAVLDAMRAFGCSSAEIHYVTPCGTRATFVGGKAVA